MPEIYNAADKNSPLESILSKVDKYSQVMRHERPSRNPLGAFAPKPLMIYGFDSQLDNEHVLLLLRQHPITQVKIFLTALVLFLMPFFFSQVGFYEQLTANYQTALSLFWYLIVMGYIFESFLLWFFNVYIVTDERIIDIDFLSLIYRNISAAKIDNIEDITAVSSGAMQSLFDYGVVRIQTAAERTEFEFENVPHPTRVTQFLNEMLEEEEQEKLQGRVR